MKSSRSQELLALTQALVHPYSLAQAQHWAATLHYYRREVPAVQAQAEALLTLATAQGFSLYGWFTEGFDTADLQEAKALLEELA